ncbi:MAG: hypothetical protein FWE02_02885 [Defluviitaleaceae bacterium]|nr:hypothetical protein [Defluviitaleaceae bacterium]
MLTELQEKILLKGIEANNKGANEADITDLGEHDFILETARNLKEMGYIIFKGDWGWKSVDRIVIGITDRGGHYFKQKAMKEEEMKRERVNISPTFHNNPILNNNNEVNIKIQISYDMVFEAVDKSQLDETLKNELRGMIVVIDQLLKSEKKDKNKIWEKIKSTFKWIGDKAVDLGLAVVVAPYLAQILQAL